MKHHTFTAEVPQQSEQPGLQKHVRRHDPGSGQPFGPHGPRLATADLGKHIRAKTKRIGVCWHTGKITKLAWSDYGRFTHLEVS